MGWRRALFCTMCPRPCLCGGQGRTPRDTGPARVGPSVMCHTHSEGLHEPFQKAQADFSVLMLGEGSDGLRWAARRPQRLSRPRSSSSCATLPACWAASCSRLRRHALSHLLLVSLHHRGVHCAVRRCGACRHSIQGGPHGELLSDCHQFACGGTILIDAAFGQDLRAQTSEACAEPPRPRRARIWMRTRSSGASSRTCSTTSVRLGQSSRAAPDRMRARQPDQRMRAQRAEPSCLSRQVSRAVIVSADCPRSFSYQLVLY